LNNNFFAKKNFIEILLSFSAKLKNKGNKKIYFFITQVGFANFVYKT